MHLINVSAQVGVYKKICDRVSVGDYTPFTKATFITGEESRKLLDDGYPGNPKARILSDSIPRDRTRFLKREDYTTSIANVPHAMDYFEDGSLYIIDAPGHLSGHINVLARTSEDGSWILLGGDTCHDVRLLTGEKQMFYEADQLGKFFPVRTLTRMQHRYTSIGLGH